MVIISEFRDKGKDFNPYNARKMFTKYMIIHKFGIIFYRTNNLPSFSDFLSVRKG